MAVRKRAPQAKTWKTGTDTAPVAVADEKRTKKTTKSDDDDNGKRSSSLPGTGSQPHNRHQKKPKQRQKQKRVQDTEIEEKQSPGMTMRNLIQRQPVWVLLAVASGTCAAFNGVFAKLTTTSLTSSISLRLAALLSLSPSSNNAIEFLTRATFFGLNLVFNVAMWALFTAALTRAASTTRVSIVNVSANFMVTAMLGWAVFGEKLPPLWWVGAALLAAGNVVIGRRQEDKEGVDGGGGAAAAATSATAAGEAAALLVAIDDDNDGGGGGDEEHGTAVRGNSIELLEPDVEDRRRLRKGEDVDAPV